MRTTLTLDDDVAAALERLSRGRGTSFKAVVNDVLRAGLRAIEKRTSARRVHRTTGFDLGASRVGSLDNVADVIARVEGESHG